MIDGAHITPGKKRKRTKVKKVSGAGVWLARSCPDFEEEGFPGEGMPAFVPEQRSGVEKQDGFYEPKEHELAPRALSLSALGYEGYWSCKAPCYHIQRAEAGDKCGRCGAEGMKWNEAIGE